MAIVRRADAAHGDAWLPRTPDEVGLVPRHGDLGLRWEDGLLSRRCLMSMCRVYLWRETFLEGKDIIGGNEAWFQFLW